MTAVAGRVENSTGKPSGKGCLINTQNKYEKSQLLKQICFCHFEFYLQYYQVLYCTRNINLMSFKTASLRNFRKFIHTNLSLSVEAVLCAPSWICCSHHL